MCLHIFFFALSFSCIFGISSDSFELLGEKKKKRLRHVRYSTHRKTTSWSVFGLSLACCALCYFVSHSSTPNLPKGLKISVYIAIKLRFFLLLMLTESCSDWLLFISLHVLLVGVRGVVSCNSMWVYIPVIWFQRFLECGEADPQNFALLTLAVKCN